MSGKLKIEDLETPGDVSEKEAANVVGGSDVLSNRSGSLYKEGQINSLNTHQSGRTIKDDFATEKVRHKISIHNENKP